MERLNKILEEIKEHQMQTVQLARTTKVYKLVEEAQRQALIIANVSGSFTETDVERAYDDGYSTDGEVTFNIDNYR